MKDQDKLNPQNMIKHVVSQYKINQYKATHKIPKVHTVGLYDADKIVHRQNKQLLQKNLPKLAHREMTPKEAEALDNKLNANQGLINALDIAQDEEMGEKRKGSITTFTTKEPKFDIDDVKSGHLAKRWAKASMQYNNKYMDNDDDLTNQDSDTTIIKFDALNRVAPKGFPRQIQHIHKIKQEAPVTFKDAVGQIGTSSKAYQRDIKKHLDIHNIDHQSSFNDFDKSASKELGRTFHRSKVVQQTSAKNQNSNKARAYHKALQNRNSRQR